MSFFFSNHDELNDAAGHALTSFRQSGLLVISGPSGSGKTDLAAKIHQHGFEKAGPFIIQDAAGLAESRFESQFFGHVKGAFSGANQAFQGLVGMSAEGTLCIEGLEDLSLNIQARLLRFLQSRSYRALGATLEHVFQGRLILTARTPLRLLIRDGVLREDFFFRVSGFEFELPPVHKRPLDFSAVCKVMIERIREELGFAVRVPTEAELNGLSGGRIEGNYHGLKNLLQRAMIQGCAPEKEESSLDGAWPGELPDTGSLKTDLHVLERSLIERALHLFPHSRIDLANHLGISIRSLMYKLKDHGFNKNDDGA